MESVCRLEKKSPTGIDKAIRVRTKIRKRGRISERGRVVNLSAIKKAKRSDRIERLRKLVSHFRKIPLRKRGNLSFSSFFIFYFVAERFDGDHGIREKRYFFPDSTDMDVDRPGRAKIVIAPDLV